MPAGISTSTPEESPNQMRQRLVESLRRDGVALARVGDLFSDELWHATLADAESFLAAGETRIGEGGEGPRKKDDYILRKYDPPKKKGVRRADAPRPTLSLESPLLRLGASDVLLDVVNGYRDRWTTLYYADYWLTLPYPRAPDRIASQRWHRDPEDKHVVKVFLYLSDVDEGAGPFEYVRGSAPGGRYGDLWPWGRDEPQYPPPEEFELEIDANDIRTLTGATGTVILCDTTGFHRGGFARTKPRALCAWTYVGPEGGERRFIVDFASDVDDLSQQARFALA
jgi:hypothetical protein